ncbi:ankyrin repeat domain-containing protein [Massilia sp. S19_KUP03_FR1]|uniref:ankyrin repeat domain-containing protein n=1 Tax=Massilia sp. S19_KUP03_FR1 TaxID=3025503 RepID=UPI002FCD833E
MTSIDETSRAIFSAAREGDADTLLSLIGTSQDRLHAQTPFGTLLHITYARGDIALVKELINLGADIDRRGGTFDGTAINLAASKGQVEIVEYLLECQAELDVSDPERKLLWGGIDSGSVEIVKLLVAAGIDATVRYSGKNMTNMGALDFAIERGQVEVAEFLQTLPSMRVN